MCVVVFFWFGGLFGFFLWWFVSFLSFGWFGGGVFFFLVWFVVFWFESLWCCHVVCYLFSLMMMVDFVVSFWLM